MNIQLLLEVADAISKHEERFDMRNVLCGKECGTTGCIAGWALMLGGVAPKMPMGLSYQGGTLLACHLLGIDRQSSLHSALFCPPYWEIRECWTAADGVAHIHRFIQEYATPAELEEYQRLQRQRIIQPK